MPIVEKAARHDDEREHTPLELGEPADNVRFDVEVDNIDTTRQHHIKVDAPPTQETSWGARLFEVRNPEGVPVTLLQGTGTESVES
jgi:hypothetical protein